MVSRGPLLGFVKGFGFRVQGFCWGSKLLPQQNP